jgi:hypothetical protein
MLAGAGAASLAACSADGPPFGLDDGGAAPVVRRTPGEVVAAYAEALSARDFETYASLLEPEPDSGRAAAGFRYYPLQEQLDELPWMQADSWDRAEELGMIGHMMDSTFVSEVTGETVDRIGADLTILSTNEGDEGITVHTYGAFQVLWTAQSGARVDSRLDFLLVADADGNLRIRSQRELRPFQRLSPAESSWGVIKSLYR